MIGRTLGNYRVVEQIGMGGMAAVYKAYDPDTDRYVALKILPEHYSKDPSFQERFRREAKAIARLEHIHILPVHGYGEQDGTSYLVMRLMETGTLSDRIKRGPIPLEEASRLLSQIASALDHAHSQGIIHRDIKPSNILLDRNNNAFLTDFGIAKMVEGSTIDLTGTGIVGTPQYMSPEQCRGEKNLTAASDIYSLGVVAYEMITGRAPFQAETPLAVIHMQLNEPLPPPRTLRPDLSERIESAVLKALAKQPESRYPSCAAMADAFAQAVSQHIARFPADAEANQRTITPSTDPTRPVDATDSKTEMLPKKRQIPIWAIALIALVILGVGAVVVMGLLTNCCAPPPTFTLTANAIVAEVATNTPSSSDTPAFTATFDALGPAQATLAAQAAINAAIADIAHQTETALAALSTATSPATETPADTPTITLTSSPEPDIIVAQANTSAELGDYEAAVAIYTQAIEADPSSASAYNGRGISYLYLEQWELAAADFTQAVSLNPNIATSYYNLGEAHAALNDLDAAIEDFAQAIEVDPNYVEAYVRRGDAYAFLEDYDSAIANYTQAIEIEPTLAWAYNNRGYAYMSTGDLDNAITDFTSVIEIDPTYNSDIYEARGDAYLTAGNYEAAIADYTHAIENDPDQPASVYYNLGDAHLGVGDLDAALDDMNRAIEIDPAYMEAYIKRGDIYTAQGNYETAIADYSQAIDIQPTAWAYSSRGSAYTQLGQYDQASADFAQAIRLDPDDPFVYYLLGENYHQQGQYEAAAEAYTQAIEINPDFEIAYHERGYAYTDLGQYDEAIADFTRAIALNENNIDAYAALGDAYYEAERLDEALDAYRQHIDHAGDAPYDYVVQNVSDIEAQLAAPPGSQIVSVGGLGGIIRAAPDGDAERLATADSGQELIVTGISLDGHYYQIDFNGQVGWISVQFVGEIDASSLPVIETFTEIEPQTLIVGGLGGIIRSAPDGDAERLATIDPRQELTTTAISTDGRYYRVEYEGQVGWISARFVTESSADDTSTTGDGAYVEGAELFYDDFEDGSADGWELEPGAEVVQDTPGNHVLRIVAPEGDYYIHTAVGDTAWENYALEFRVRVVDTASDGTYVVGINVRIDWSREGCAEYFTGLEDWGSYLQRDGDENCPTTTLAEMGEMTIGADDWHTVRLEVYGDTVSVYIDGALILSAVDSEPILNGSFGLEADRGTTAYFDDVRVVELVPAHGVSQALTATVVGNSNLRDGPGAFFNIVGTVLLGDTVTVVGRNADSTWLLVTTESGQTVWISASRVDVPNNLSALPDAEPTPMAVTVTDNSNLRDGPGAFYTIVGTVEAGENLTVIGRNADGSWLQVTTEAGQTVWISASRTDAPDNLIAVPIVAS